MLGEELAGSLHAFYRFQAIRLELENLPGLRKFALLAGDFCRVDVAIFRPPCLCPGVNNLERPAGGDIQLSALFSTTASEPRR